MQYLQNSLFLVGFLMLNFQCDSPKKAATPSLAAETRVAPNELLLNLTWRHAREDDAADGARCFRPAGYAFPPTRGVRTSYTFHKDGTGEKGSTAKNDGNLAQKFTWQQANSLLTLTFDKTTETYTIVSLEKDKLFLK